MAAVVAVVVFVVAPEDKFTGISFCSVFEANLRVEGLTSKEEADLNNESVELLRGLVFSVSCFLSNLSKQMSDTMGDLVFFVVSVSFVGSFVGSFVSELCVVGGWSPGGGSATACTAFPKSCCLRFCSSSAQNPLLSEKRECVRRIC